jgi:RNA polymerase sigma-70 factor (ECF subfamily)
MTAMSRASVPRGGAGGAPTAQQPDAAAGCGDDDATLAARIALGDARAFEALYRRESARVYRYALAMCNDADLAADTVQETFLTFAQRAQGYAAERGPLQAYLVGIARHHVLGRWNEAQRFVPLAGDDDDCAGGVDLQQLADGAPDPGAALVARQSAAQLMAALARLPAPFREAIVLVELQDMSYADAAALAGIELNTLRTRVHRAKTKLARLLRAEAAATAPITAGDDDHGTTAAARG